MYREQMKTIGVLGGMGPMATVNLVQTIVGNTLAKSDQEHPPVIIDSNTRIADRTAFLLGQSAEDPRPEIFAAASRLETSGVACIVMPCNTAHAFYPDIVAVTKAEVIHMIEETARWIRRTFPKEKKIGVLATQGTYRANVYHEGLAKFGLTQVVPDEQGQEEVTKLIYDGIKANNLTYDFTGYEKAITRFKRENDIEVVILGCTELSVAQSIQPVSGTFVDPLRVAARVSIEKVGGKLISL